LAGRAAMILLTLLLTSPLMSLVDRGEEGPRREDTGSRRVLPVRGGLSR
jgi:hypothetical protein